MYVLFCYFIDLWMLFVLVVFVLVGFYVSIFLHKRQVGDVHSRLKMFKSYRLEGDDESLVSEEMELKKMNSNVDG